MSQMGTMIVHRLTNDYDRKVIERSAATIDSSSVELLPALTPGEAVLTGSDFTVPLRILVHKPVNPPLSQGASFQELWKQ